MADLRSRVEIAKLAREVDVPTAELAFLADAAPEELRELRRVTAEALFRRHETRAKMLASASNVLPAAVNAKITERSLGPRLSARVAGVMEPQDAAKMAGHLSSAFQARLAAHLDPSRVGPIVALLDHDVVLDIAERLLAAGDVVTLARFVAIVDPRIAARVAERASGEQLLQMGLYVEDTAALQALYRELPEETTVKMLAGASDAEEYDAAVDLLDGLDEATRERVLGQAPRP